MMFPGSDAITFEEVSVSKTFTGLLGCALLTLAGTAAAADDLRLIQAVKQQDAAAAQALIRQKVDINARQPDGATALHWAAYHDDVRLLGALIGGGANVNAVNELGVTPLFLASQNGNAAVVAKLLDAKADPNLVLPTGESPLMAASRAGSAAAVEALLAHGAQANAAENSQHQTALMWAVAAQHPEVARLLVRSGADIKLRTKVTVRWVYTGMRFVAAPPSDTSDTIRQVPEGGFSALLLAAQQGDVQSINLLLEAGADVDDTAPIGTSALVVAAHSGHGAAAKTLLDRGADPNRDGAGYTALHAAVLRGDLDLVKALLGKGADPNAVLTKGNPVRKYGQEYALTVNWKGATPIWLAARFGEPAIVQALAAAGAKPEITAEDGTAPLLAAIPSSNGQGDRRERYMTESEAAAIPPDEDENLTLETVKALVGAGVNINNVDKNGNTPLHLASARLYNTVVKYLADRGADLNVQNKKGQTPLKALITPRQGAGLVAAGGVVIASPPQPLAPGTEATADLLRQLGAK
jgi:ankyrin repeat protein